jgi:hypothetical protein
VAREEHISVEQYREMVGLPAKPRQGAPTVDAPKRTKYRNKPTWIDGIRFASGHEANRYLELKLMYQNGMIISFEYRKANLRYPMVVKDMYLGYYEADFRYIRRDTGELIVEDAKSQKTRMLDLYKWKIKLMKVLHGITVQEV